MAKAPSRTPLIAAIVMVVAGLAILNTVQERLRPKSEHEEQAAQKEAQEAAAKNAPKATPAAVAATPAPPPAEGGNRLVNWGEETVLGPKTATKEIVVGWGWTPAVQGDPTKITSAIDALQKAAPDAKIRVVNTDADASVPDGVSVGGKVVVPLAADGGLPANAGAYQAVAATR